MAAAAAASSSSRAAAAATTQPKAAAATGAELELMFGNISVLMHSVDWPYFLYGRVVLYCFEGRGPKLKLSFDAEKLSKTVCKMWTDCRN